MHYFKFNIATWIQSTRHLSPQDEGIYLRLINHYYDTEVSFPVDLKPILKRLQLLQYADSVDEILSDFFVLTDKGWQHNKCNELLKEFKKSAKKNKVNGAKGGRPAKAKALSVTQKEPNGLPVGTQTEPKHNPNYELRTTNYKLETKEKTLVGKPDDSDFESIWVLYGKKGNRKTSLQKFNKLNKANLALLKNHLPKYVQSTPDLQYRKGLQSYIEKECWNDEITTTGNYYEAAKNNHARPESNLARLSRQLQADISAEDPFK
jgi:uncharacterized protein YdaU (DUF1376 family)